MNLSACLLPRRQVALQPLVMQVAGLPDLQKTLERLHDQLFKVQRSLGEYLENQRAAFPRFYFVGDEDLLEIIGHSKEPLQVWTREENRL